MLLEPVPCELCHSSQCHELFHGRDRLMGTPGQFRIVQCTNCGLVYTSPRPTPESIAECYPEGYGVYAPRGGQAARIAYYHRRIARRLDKLITGAPRRVLDIGCADGAFLTEMTALGWEGVGLEMDASAAALARSQRGLDVQTGSIETADFPPGSFHLITLSHVVEHLPHPVAALHRVKSWLRDDGLVFVTLPNVASWERRVFGPDWYHWDLPRHLFHFSPVSLARLLNRVGFESTDIRYLSGFTLPQSLRYRLRRSSIPDPALPNTAVPDPAANGKEALKTLIFRTLLTCAALAGRIIPGEIQEVTARKAAG